MAESRSPPALPEACPLCSQATPICRKLPSSPTGGLPNLQPSKPYLQKATIQPYLRPAHSAANHPNPTANHPNQAAKHPNTATKHPNPTANHPNPAAEATDAAEAIIRDYGITN